KILQALLDKAEELLEKNEYALAEKIANEILESVNENNVLPPDNKARAFCILGTCARLTSRYDEALAHFQTAAVATASGSNLRLQSRALIGTAYVLRVQGDYDAAIQT